VSREVVLEHLQDVFNLFDSTGVMCDRCGGRLGRAVLEVSLALRRIGCASFFGRLCSGEIGVRRLNVASERTGELGVLAACLKDAGIDLRITLA
jgi:hypothetical protein